MPTQPFSPWLGPQNKITPATLDPAWSNTLTPAQAKSMAWMRGSFAGDDPNQQPIGLGHMQGQGTVINAPLPKKTVPTPKPRLAAAPTVQPPAEAPSGIPDVQAPPPVDQRKYEELLGRLDPDNLDSFGNQQASLDELSSLYDKLSNKEHETDYSPLLAYHDSHYGTNLQKGYQRPMSDDEKLGAQAALQEHILQGEQGLTQNETSVLNDALSAEARRLGIDENALTRRFNADQANQMKKEVEHIKGGYGTDIGAGHDQAKVTAAGISAAGKAGAGSDKLLRDFQKNYEKQTKTATGAMEHLDEAGAQLENAHNVGGPQAISSLGLSLAGAIANRLNRQEIEAMNGHDNQSIANEVERIYTTAKNGKLNDTQYNYLKKYIEVARQAKTRIKQEALRDQAIKWQQHPANKGRSIEDGMQAIGGGDYTPPAAPGSAPAASVPALPSTPKVMNAKDLP